MYRSLKDKLANTLAHSPGLTTIGCFTPSNYTLNSLNRETLLSLAVQSGFKIRANQARMDRRSFTTIQGIKTLDLVIQKEPLIIETPQGSTILGDETTVATLLQHSKTPLFFFHGEPFFQEKMRPKDMEHIRFLEESKDYVGYEIEPDTFPFMAVFAHNTNAIYVDRHSSFWFEEHIFVSEFFPELNTLDEATCFLGVYNKTTKKAVIEDLLYYQGQDLTTRPLKERLKVLPYFLDRYNLSHANAKQIYKNRLHENYTHGIVFKDLNAPYAVSYGRYVVEHQTDLYYLGYMHKRGGKTEVFTVANGQLVKIGLVHTPTKHKVTTLKSLGVWCIISNKSGCLKLYERQGIEDFVDWDAVFIKAPVYGDYLVCESYNKLKFLRRI